jgi:hypothetical protein
MPGAKKPVITICSSSSFYRQAGELKDILTVQGFEVIIPKMAEEMKAKNNFERIDYQPWLKDPSAYHVKAGLIRDHFNEVAKADAILVLNYEKHGVANYIGGNVLMEMGIAFHLKMPIFILNEAPTDVSYAEEVLGLEPIMLKGKIEHFAAEYKKVKT